MNKTQNGYSLVEVMISLILMGITIYVFDQVQITTLKINNNTYYLTQATHQMISMRERLFALSNYSGLEQQITRWNEENHHVLPSAVAAVSGQYPFYQIKLCWHQKGETQSCLTMDVVVPMD